MFDSEFLIIVQADNVRAREHAKWGNFRDSLRNLQSDTAVITELFNVAVCDILADGDAAGIL